MLGTLLVALLSVAEIPVHVTMGQSLACGWSANAVNYTPVGNNRQSSGSYYDMVALQWKAVSPGSSLEPLISTTNACNPYPSFCLSGYLEPPSVGLADYYFTLTGKSTLTAVGMRDGAPYTYWMQPGAPPFKYVDLQLAAYGSVYGGYCEALNVMHGEADHLGGTATSTYAAFLVEWQQNFQAECNAVMPNQNGRVAPLVVSQVSSWTSPGMGSYAASAIPIAQYEAAKAYPSKILLSGGKYSIPYTDGIHGTGDGYNHWGAESARAIVTWKNTGVWEPLWPVSYARAGATVVVTYNVPEPPLLLGTSCNGGGLTVTDVANYGFEYSTSAISNVALCTGVNTPVTGCFAPATCTGLGVPRVGCSRPGQHVSGVSYTLTTPGPGIARYAFTGTPGATAGPATGARGQLCDSDSRSYAGYSLRNWAVHSGSAVYDAVP